MADLVNGISVPFLPIGGVDGLKERPSVDLTTDQSFDAVLQDELNSVKFSKHAQQRLEERNITLSSTEMKQLNDAVQKASDKGSNESLVLLKNVAFVVSVKNKTVITAMDSEQIKDNVFTNIDSAVISG
jgi:flagellar operon protein